MNISIDETKWQNILIWYKTKWWLPYVVWNKVIFNIAFSFYRHGCFTGKYTTHKIHIKLHPGPEWRIFHILTSADFNDVIWCFSQLFVFGWFFVFIIKRTLQWYMLARRYEVYVLVARTICHKWVQGTSEILFLPQKHKTDIFS